MPGEVPQTKLQCVTVPEKGRGMVSSCNISPGSLVHSEEPYAMVRNISPCLDLAIFMASFCLELDVAKLISVKLFLAKI